MAAKRLIKELEKFRKEPSTAVASLEPCSDEDLFHLTARLRGPRGTAYEGGEWSVSITVPATTYPNSPPAMHFTTPLCHPNVNFQTGEICLDLLKTTAWTPAYGLVSALEAVHQLLANGGEPDSPLNLDLARLLREGDLVGAESLIRLYTRMYAMG
ncbi:hypothetical protein NU219Hw_g5674t1 [Hortaea werneckii]